MAIAVLSRVAVAWPQEVTACLIKDVHYTQSLSQNRTPGNMLYTKS